MGSLWEHELVVWEVGVGVMKEEIRLAPATLSKWTGLPLIHPHHHPPLLQVGQKISQG